MRWVIIIIKFIWELPQNFLGIILIVLYRRKIVSMHKISGRYFFQIKNAGISLGSFIFWSGNKATKKDNQAHEYGHSMQSLFLGPLYLFLIGIPSLARVIYSKIYYLINKKRWENYFKGHPEDWADRLGNESFKMD